MLRLKMKAELGAEPFNVSDDIDPEIENQFLKNVLAFEHNFAITKPSKVYDLIGQPDFKKSAELDDTMIDAALKWAVDLLAQKNMEVLFGDNDEYDSRTQYHFITEELFEHETTFPPMPGMVTHFDYEEFHPNHKKDIENRTIEFLEHWFERSLNEKCWELSDHFILPDRRVLPKAEVVAQMKSIFDAYSGFTDEKHKIFDIGFQLDENYGGMGHAEGAVAYRATMDNGEYVIFKGPFKLYLELQGSWWSILHVVLPGFQYH